MMDDGAPPREAVAMEKRGWTEDMLWRLTQRSSLAELKFGNSEVWPCLEILLIPGNIHLGTSWDGEGMRCNFNSTHKSPLPPRGSRDLNSWASLLGFMLLRLFFIPSLHKAHVYFC